jgi:hypothetical protein
VSVPKVGTLSDLAIKGPTPETEGEYVRSVLRSITLLSQALGQLGTVQESIPNLDLDTGAKVRPGGYRLTDQTYAALLGRITAQPERVIPSGLKDDIAGYYADPTAPITTRNHPAQWAKVQHDLVVLLAMKTRPEL